MSVIDDRRLRIGWAGLAAVAIAVVSIAPALAGGDEGLFGPWVRGTNDNKSLCGTAFVHVSELGGSAVKRHNMNNGCTAGLTGSDYMITAVEYQFLAWDFNWYQCGYDYDARGADDEAYALTTNEESCPTGGVTYRSVAVFGGDIGSTYYSTNHFPGVTETVVI